MKKFNKVLLIILLVALFLGAAGVVAGTVLGAHPVEIGGTILEEAAARSNLENPHIARLIPSPTPAAE